jgi:hypothetical protein
MAQPKVDGVIEAVHYTVDGTVVWVRAYERRGPTFSDRVLISREDLIARLKSGKKYFAGQRKKLEASTFELAGAVRLEQTGGRDILAVGQGKSGQDFLEGVPVI